LTTFVVTATHVAMTRRTTLLLLVVEEIDDDTDHPPSFPPFAVETTGEAVPDTARPPAKCATSNVVPLRRTA
jgi:hypothetical protein